MSITPQELLELVRIARTRLQELSLPEPAMRICVLGLARMEQVLTKPPRIAIMGEVNSGKTSVADLLLGVGVLPASVIANTHVPVVIRYSDETTVDAVTQEGPYRLTEDTLDELPSGLQLKQIEIGLPDERLHEYELLDTPGHFTPGGDMPDAQIFLWCTVATRAWTESERAHWASLPPRCRRRGRLLATHKDALVSAQDIAKVEQRLRKSTADLFQDVLFVNAAGAAPGTSNASQPEKEPSVADLRKHVSGWVAEVNVRRAAKAERIVRHLARLTLHRLAPGPFSFEADSILTAWKKDSAKMLEGVDSADKAPVVIRELLTRFARSMEEMQAGRRSRDASPVFQERRARAKTPIRAPAAHRFVALIRADLTALLHINLAQWGLNDATKRADYATARSILFPLANLDAIFNDLGQKLNTATDRANEGPPPVHRPPPLGRPPTRTLGAG